MSERIQKAFQVLGQRKVWETRQRHYYQMRHDGMPRLKKPFPGAADAHFPLIDMAIGNLKPFWIAQAFNGERLADFVCMRQQLQDMTEAAADYMDFELRYKTNFRYVMEQAVDTMLLRGRGIVKISFDPFTNKIVYAHRDPLFIIMDECYDDFEDADWWTEIQTLTVAQYLRNRNFNHTAGVLQQLRGKTGDQLEQIRLDKQLREGVTHSTKGDLIVLWHTYEKTDSGYVVHTECPIAKEAKVREPFNVTLEFDGEKLQPFYSLTMEIKDEGWYSPRGIAELNAALEAYATKLWNEKADAMTFSNRPLFTSEKEIPNAGNVRFQPGEYIPGNLQEVQRNPPAFSFAEEINFTRGLSEQRSKMPDYGVTSEGDSQTGGKPRTATENNRIASLQDVGADHNGDIFRNIRLLKIYRHSWACICQREQLLKQSSKPGDKERTLAYFVADSLKALPEQSLHDQYLVLPAGSSGTRQQRIQRGMMLYSTFKGDPGIDQEELHKVAISPVDARLVTKLVIPQNLKGPNEAYQEDIELIVMSQGRPVPVMPGQDHATRIMECAGFLQKQHVTGAPVDVMALHVIQQHIQQHMQILQQQQPKVAQQVKMQLVMMMRQTMQGPQAGQPGQPGQGQPPQGMEGGPS